MKSTEASAQVNHQFAADVYAGLTAEKKFLPSKYLYNKRGDEIFQQIRDLTESDRFFKIIYNKISLQGFFREIFL